MQPSSEKAMVDYFVHQAERLAYSTREASIATIAAHYCLANIFVVDDVVIAQDPEGNDVNFPWYVVQKSIFDEISEDEGLRNQLFGFILNLSDEELMSICRVGDGENCAYKSDEEFIADIDWDLVKNSIKESWILASTL